MPCPASLMVMTVLAGKGGAARESDRRCGEVMVMMAVSIRGRAKRLLSLASPNRVQRRWWHLYTMWVVGVVGCPVAALILAGCAQELTRNDDDTQVLSSESIITLRRGEAFEFEVPASHTSPTNLSPTDSEEEQIKQLKQALSDRRESMRQLLSQQSAIMSELQTFSSGCSLEALSLDVIKVTPTAVQQDDRVFGKNLDSGQIKMYQVDTPDQLTISWADDMSVKTDPAAFFKGGYSTTEFADKSLSDMDYIVLSRTGFNTFSNRGIKTYPAGFFGNKLLKIDRYGYHEMGRYALKGLKVEITSGNTTHTVFSRVDLDEPFYWPVGHYSAYNIRFDTRVLDLYHRQDSACAQ